MTDQEIMKFCERMAAELTHATNDLRQRGYEVKLKSVRVPLIGEAYTELYTVEAYKLVKLTGDTEES
jgi:hypothetical protein